MNLSVPAERALKAREAAHRQEELDRLRQAVPVQRLRTLSVSELDFINRHWQAYPRFYPASALVELCRRKGITISLSDVTFPDSPQDRLNDEPDGEPPP